MGTRLGRIIGWVVAVLAAVDTAWAGEPLPERFHFPPLEPDRSLSVKAEGTPADRPPRWQARMVVDGTLTDGRWPEHPPTVYRIGKRAYLLDDLYSGAGDFVWDTAEKKLTPIGRCFLRPVPGVGTVVVRRPDGERPAVEVLDSPGEHGRPRVLWSGRGPSLAPLGVWDGAVVFVLGGERLLLLEPGWPAKEIDIDLGKFHWQATGDSIRRGKALLLGDVPPPGSGHPRVKYTVSVAVINLKTREIKTIGRIPGAWSIDTNVPHPVVSASWITQQQADKLRKFDTIGVTQFGGSYVFEETDQIVK
jgi:hypothetical protein